MTPPPIASAPARFKSGNAPPPAPLVGGPIVATNHGSDRGAERLPAMVERPTGPVSVERTTHQDVPAICALYKKVWEPMSPSVPLDLLKSWQPTPLEFTSWMEGVNYFSARRDGRLVGVVGCELRHGSCHLMHLAVDPDVRRQGIGSALLGAAVEWAKRSNASSIWVDALARFTEAAALLRRLGFAEAGLLHRHKWNEDVLFFERTL
jgi:GNAT superfamily N-acetyltransferase